MRQDQTMKKKGPLSLKSSKFLGFSPKSTLKGPLKGHPAESCGQVWRLHLQINLICLPCDFNRLPKQTKGSGSCSMTTNRWATLEQSGKMSSGQTWSSAKAPLVINILSYVGNGPIERDICWSCIFFFLFGAAFRHNLLEWGCFYCVWSGISRPNESPLDLPGVKKSPNTGAK